MPRSSTTPANKYDSSEGIADPQTCGEDLRGNLESVFAIAAEHCGDCADYHIVKAAMRVAGSTMWEEGARPYLLQALESNFSALANSDSESIDVAVAACADTAVLSACAHAAVSAGEETFRRTRFTVVDKCRTPLKLCEQFGERHGLKVQTEVVDLTESAGPGQADIVVVNNLLPFVPRKYHVRLLRNLGSWLKTDGKAILWASVYADKGQTDIAHGRHEKRKERLRALIDSGQLPIAEPAQTFLARLDRNVDGERYADADYKDAESLIDVVKSSGLAVRSLFEIPSFRQQHTAKVVIVAGRGRD